MDYQKFLEQLPQLYETWGTPGVTPKSKEFQEVLGAVQSTSTEKIVQVLSLAVSCMEAGEVYCEIGCWQGASLIAALRDNPDKMAYAVDNFSEFDTWGDSLEKLTENLAKFNVEEQVYLCQQDFEEFFAELKELESSDKIGVYYYDGAHDYRSQLMGMLLVKPFLADRALILTSFGEWAAVRQATWDFLAVSPEAKLVAEIPDMLVIEWGGDTHSQGVAEERERQQELIEAIAELSARERQEKVESLYQEAVSLDVSENLAASIAAGMTYSPEFLSQVRKDLQKAEEKYREVLQWEKRHSSAWLRLAKLYYVLERYPEALEILLKSLEIVPAGAQQHYSLGLVLEKLGEIPQAMRAYQEAIALDSSLSEAYNNLGNLLLSVGELEQAEAVYRACIAANPEQYGSYLNWGNLLMEKGAINEAISAYETALKFSPNNPDILYNLGVARESNNNPSQAYLCFGNAFYFRGEYEKAIKEYENFLETETGDVEFYLGLAYCYICLNREEEAIKVYREAIRIYPTSAIIYNRLGFVLQELGQVREAIQVASDACLLIPDDLSLKFAKYLTLPALYESPEEIDFYRRRFSQGLEAIIQQTTLDTPEARKNALIGISRHTNFYLQYQGCNDLELQKQYGQFVHQIMAANYPEWVEARSRPPLNPDKKIRVGYISDCMRSHTVARLSLGWLRSCDRQKFEIYSYYTSRRQPDQFTQEFHQYSDKFYQTDELEKICQQVSIDRLHVLVFLDLGMNPLMTQIAALRLAPVQCTTWCHPITSGLPTVDYFLSSDLMEPENAQEHYSEQLVRLPNIGISYPKPAIEKSAKTRSDFQIREDAIVYLSCQAPYKYLPQHDYIFAEIALRVPQAQFVHLARPTEITKQLVQRWQRAFAKVGLNSEDYWVILPYQTQKIYWDVNLQSDIFLDTIGWSGGHTTLEAIACNLPIVTCPGEFMRGRHSYGILQMLGVTETIAENEAEYIEIAVRLGRDIKWRKSLVQRMKKRHFSLYDDRICVKEMESFYQRVVEEKYKPVSGVAPLTLRK